MLIPAALAFSTLISEDLACVAAGVLVAEGRLHPLTAIAACATGIVAGDFGLWMIGRSGMELTRFVRRPPAFRAAPLAARIRRHAGAAIVASRFLPGTRLPLYLAAGALGVPAGKFLAWSALAVAIWTPIVVLLSAGLGRGSSVVFQPDGLAFAARLLAAASVVPLIALARVVAVPSLRRRAAARLARWRRWEFWPMWLFYGPVALWVAWLSLRYRGLTTITASNPAIPEGGIVGESKYDILSRLPAAWVIPAVRVAPGDGSRRTNWLRDRVAEEGWAFPLVLKPDAGQRGVGVKRIESWEEAERYLETVHGPVLAQPYHKGPFEAGVFYYRFPHWSHGKLLSITDKVFPELVGDGQSTVEQLIWRHPRFRLQADTFLARHQDASARVLANGERLPLAMAGNHAQGTLFRDGAHLVTPELEARIDEIARHRPGFFIGRFDVRYRTMEGFKAGLDLSIVELNGATAESTNIYDPDRSLWSAYRTLCRQWTLVFAIGAANRRQGAAVSPLTHLARLVRAHLATAVAYPVSD